MKYLIFFIALLSSFSYCWGNDFISTTIDGSKVQYVEYNIHNPDYDLRVVMDQDVGNLYDLMIDS